LPLHPQPPPFPSTTLFRSLSVSRFREALAASGDPVQAAVATGRSAGRTILLSGLTVALGFAALLAVPLGELRSVAVGGLLATALDRKSTRLNSSHDQISYA